MGRGTILILGEPDHGAWLSHVRSLGRAGYAVDAAFTRIPRPWVRTGYLRHHHRLPPFDREPQAWTTRLLELVDRHRPELVLPIDEPSWIACQSQAGLLSGRVRLELLPEPTWRRLWSRPASRAHARMRDVPIVPGGLLLPRDERIDALPHPLWLHPTTRFRHRDLMQARVPTLCADPAQTREALAALDGPAVWEVPTPGSAWHLTVLCRQGRLLTCLQSHSAALQVGRLRRITSHATPISPSALSLAEKVAGAWSLDGLWTLHLRRHPQDGHPTLSHITPPEGDILALADRAGLDLPLWNVQRLTGDRRRFPWSYRHGQRSDRMLTPWAAGRDQTPMPRSVDVPNTLPRPASFALDDPRPGLSGLGWLATELAPDLLRQWHNRRWASERARADARRRAVRALRSSRTLWFVCKGNICRSPFAAQWAASHLPGAIVRQAGTFPRQDRPSPDAAIAAAARLGVCLKDHRSTRLDHRHTQLPGLFVLFDEDNHQRVLDFAPHLQDRIVLLGQLHRGSTPILPDPFGEDVDAFEQCYRNIVSAMEGLAEVWEEATLQKASSP